MPTTAKIARAPQGGRIYSFDFILTATGTYAPTQRKQICAGNAFYVVNSPIVLNIKTNNSPSSPYDSQTGQSTPDDFDSLIITPTSVFGAAQAIGTQIITATVWVGSMKSWGFIDHRTLYSQTAFESICSPIDAQPTGSAVLPTAGVYTIPPGNCEISPLLELRAAAAPNNSPAPRIQEMLLTNLDTTTILTIGALNTANAGGVNMIGLIGPSTMIRLPVPLGAYRNASLSLQVFNPSASNVSLIFAFITRSNQDFGSNNFGGGNL